MSTLNSQHNSHRNSQEDSQRAAHGNSHADPHHNNSPADIGMLSDLPGDGLDQRDPLTGFYTQQALSERLTRFIQARTCNSTPMTLALLQLANFYEISTWLGDDEARQLLIALASLLRKIVPDNTLICRCRRHEFALLLVEDGSRNSPLIAAAVHQALQRESGSLVPPQLNLACSIGFARIGTDTPDSDVAFARARHAIWQERHRQLPTCAPAADGREAELAQQLTDALQEKRVKLRFQGVLGLQGEFLPRYESRAVLETDDTILPAARFVPTAVKHARGEALDRYVIARALEEIASVGQDTLQLLVNLSQNSLVSPDFPGWLSSLRGDSQRGAAGTDPAGQLILQVSELDILSTQHHLTEFCESVRALGLQLSINHFGATEDPFRYLGLFPADFARLHPSRLQRLGDSPRQQQLRSCVERLHDHGVRVIATNIENFSDLPLLWSMGIDYVQGNCLHRPSRTLDCEFVEEIELRLDQSTC